MRTKFLTLLILLFIFFPTANQSVRGAEVTASGTGYSIYIEDTAAAPGKIVSYREGTYVLSTIPYDEFIYGVITEKPVTYVEDTSLESYMLVVTEGEAFVEVTNSSGDISKGDLITTSEIPGVGQKAELPGQVLGVALQSFSSDTEGAQEGILVHVDVRTNFVSENVRVNLIEALRGGLHAPFMTPVTSLRYILAALVTAGSFVLGFASFGKTSGSGIEALGRNPLAKAEIQRSMVFHFVLTGFIMLGGIFLAYLILIL